MPLMLLVVACYTICSLSDKYAVAKLKFDGNTLTFLMAAATSLLMLFYLPFDSRIFVLSWQSFASVGLMVVSKMLEFQLAAVILKEMSAFELKAWLGITVFLSYSVDLVSGVSQLGISAVWKFCFIAVTAVGLFLIARSGGKKIDYKKILLPLVGYLLAKFGYGIIVSVFCNTERSCYISPTLSLFLALVILSVILAPKVHPIKLFKEKTNGALFVSVTKIPNVIGLVCENIVATQSMANYSFIQPMILVALFFIGLFRREECTKLNIIGGVICIAGIIGFQLF
ncbi:MAG: hypothetical protein IJO91_09015 [Oscillospiraceae bacterium]|nr:hypothetical protein [Oscillospiraceae bacterium]